MSTPSLPPRPSLEHLQKQAKALLKAHKAAEPEAVARFRDWLPPLSKTSDAEVFQSKLSLRDAQKVIAREYGFESWTALKKHVVRKDTADLAEVQIEGFRSSITNYQRVVMLRAKDSDRYLPIWIGPSEAQSIALKLQDVSPPRPMTHDLLERMITDLGATVKRVVVSDLQGDTFYATIVLQLNGDTVERDARPSDAMALAVRTGVPIFVSEEVLEKGAGLFKHAQLPESSPRYIGKLGHVRGILSDQARDVVLVAQSQARHLNHDAIGSEHLLLGLVEDAEGVGARVLIKMGLDLIKVRSMIETFLRPAEGTPSDELALTPRAARILELAGDEADRLGHHWFGTEHLLMGIMSEGKGPAAGLLKAQGVTLAKVRAESVRLLKQDEHQGH